jgi:site-specific DNA recombinase
VTGGNGNGKAAGRQIRCAIYTRKSTTEGLDMDFNTLDAQREAAEHYIRSQAQSGWIALPARYDDGGFTGGNLDRPALRRLLDDIDRGEVDMVVVYKVDRLSRSLLDFARLMDRFEEKSVGFVSITQHFDTSTSMGRLVLNVLLSFAQFERELISERTRDKIAAARRRGKWTGGQLALGYRIDRDLHALAVIPEEAALVRLIFDLYLKSRSIGVVAERLNAMGYVQKQRVTEAGRTIGGKPWYKDSVLRVLRNPLYIGKVRQGDELHDGEHDAIVDSEVFARAQQSLDEHSTGHGPRRSRKSEYILTGLLRCGSCDAAMTSAVSSGKNGKRYRYYRCVNHNQGRPCPTGQVPAAEIEAAVVAKVREVAGRGDVQKKILDYLGQDDSASTTIREQHDRLNARLAELNAEAGRLLAAFSGAEGGGKLLAGRLGELEAEMDRVRVQIGEVEDRLRLTQNIRVHAARVAEHLDAFDAVWEALIPMERRELLHLVVQQVVVDPASQSLRIAFHEVGTSTPAAAPEAEVAAAAAPAQPKPVEASP